MARDPRKKKEKKQKAGTKRYVVWGVCAALMLLLLIFGLSLIFGKNKKEDTTPTQGNTVDNTVIHLTFGGDLNITDDVVSSAVGNSYSSAFLDVANLLSGADLSMLNFEGNLCGAPYGTQSKSAPASLVQALKAAGVDLLQVANSYSINNGISGLISTIDTIRAAGIEALGAYRNSLETKAQKGYTLLEVKGIKIAYVAFTKGMDGMTLPSGSAGCVNLLYKDYDSTYQRINTEGINAVLSNARASGADLIVAALHWGSEFNDTISSTQERICKLLQAGGVDAIVGTHPHYVQKMVFNKQKGTFVAYSLGDFFGDATRAGSEYSVLLDLEITKNNVTGETTVTGYDYTPIFTVRQTARPLKVVRIKEAMLAYENNYVDRVSKETYDAMKYALERIEARVNER